MKRFGRRITESIESLQQEHKIFKRPFILQGRDYVVHMKAEIEEFEKVHPLMGRAEDDLTSHVDSVL